MNAFTAFLQNEWTELAGWALLHSLWQIAVVAAIYALAAFSLRTAAGLRYIVGCAALLAMLTLPLVTFAVAYQQAAPAAVVAASMPKTNNAHGVSTPRDATLEATSADDPPPASRAAAVRPEPAVAPAPLPVEAAPVEPPPGPGSPPSTKADRTRWLRRMLPWATAVWLAGVALFSLRLAWGCLHVRRLRFHGLEPLPAALCELARRAASRLRLARAVQCVQSRLVTTPAVIGLVRPMVLLPASAITGLSAAEIELVLAHELAHVRRHDYLANLVQTVIETLLFYHPGMWWVSRQIRKERENCCDDMVIAADGDRATYARALARLEEQRAGRCAIVMTAGGGALLTRIRRLMGMPSDESRRHRAAVYLAGPVTIIISALVLGLAATTGGDETRNTPDDAAFDTFQIEYNGHWVGPRSMTFHSDGTYSFTMQVFEPKPGEEGQFQPREEPYTAAHRLAPDHLRELTTRLEATQWLRLDARTTALATCQSEYRLKLQRRRRPAHRTYMSDVDVEAYQNLNHFIERLARQEVLYFRVTHPDLMCNGGGESLGQELDAMLRPESDASHTRPHTPALDYRRLVPPCSEIIRHPESHAAGQVLAAIKLMRYLELDSERAALEALARGQRSNRAWRPYDATKVQEEATKALGAIAGTGDLETLGAIVGEETDWRLSVTAAEAIAAIPGSEADAKLIELFRKAPRTEIAWLLIQRGKAVEPTIVDIIYEPIEQLLADNIPADALIRAYHDHWEELDVPPSEAVLRALHDRTLRLSTGPRPDYARKVLEMAGKPFRPGTAWEQLADTLSLIAADDANPRKKLLVPIHLRNNRDSNSTERFLHDAKTGDIVIREIWVDEEDFSGWAHVTKPDSQDGYELYLSQYGGAVWVVEAALDLPGDRVDARRRRFEERHPEAKEVGPPEPESGRAATYFTITKNHTQAGESGGLLKTEKTGTCAEGGSLLREALMKKTGWKWWRSSGHMFVLGYPRGFISPGHIFLAQSGWDKQRPPENYRIRVEENGVVIQAHHQEGFGRAVERFITLMEPAGENWRVPTGTYAWNREGAEQGGSPLERAEATDESPSTPKTDIILDLTPGIFRDGRQRLRVTVRNKSSERITHLEPGGFPPEILVDGVAYRWTGAATTRETDRRTIRPGTTNYGREFVLDENWVTVDDQEALELTPKKHTVQAVIYSVSETADDGSPATGVLSNSIALGPDGQAVGARDVRIRILGGEGKKPLEGIEVAVAPSRTLERINLTTEADGGVSLRLLPGHYLLSLDSAEELPYLPYTKHPQSENWRGEWITVRDTPGEQTIDFQLFDPCELVLRAVDAQTGQGVPGVVFAAENVPGEMWAEPIYNQLLGTPRVEYRRDRFQDVSLKTDQDGYFRRYVDPYAQRGWNYFVSSVPPGYKMGGHGQTAEFDITLGQRKAEHTFILRRKTAADAIELSIAGRVIGVDGARAVGYRVTALPRKWMGMGGQMPTTMTDPNGEFTFYGLPEGPCDVSVTPNPKTNQPNMRIEGVSVARGEPAEVELSLEQRYCYGGLITDGAGEPQPGRNVLAIWEDAAGTARYSSNTKTDSEGRYRFDVPFEMAESIKLNGLDAGRIPGHVEIAAGRDDIDFQVK